MQARYYKQHSTCKTISRMPWISGWFWTGKSLICKPINEYKIGIVRTFISYDIIPNVNIYEYSILCDLELEFKSWYFKISSRTLAREYHFKVTSLLLLQLLLLLRELFHHSLSCSYAAEHSMLWGGLLIQHILHPLHSLPPSTPTIAIPLVLPCGYIITQ